MSREIRIEAGEQCVYDDGILQSMYPGDLAMVRGHWIHFVSWWKPKNVLILGYGEGTMARVFKRVWGDEMRIIGVDLVAPTHGNDASTIITKDAEVFVREHPSSNVYDFLMVDLYNGDRLASCVRSPSFIADCVRLTSDTVAVNVIDGWKGDDPYARSLDLTVTKIVDRNWLYFYRRGVYPWGSSVCGLQAV